ncbi:muconolactone isomerase [uncultured phage cr106_1]|uniref:Muconolactone isomerase n=1 Tax=uncultured phage cr106_1 TaxID=2772062 RepID=A0A7M1RVH4_9CAUD|nr:muconolactone isomerase [uncultured phage cr106_1]QOR58328.1 muconolactone isomerase [uncultured phage cr106_1]
MNDIIELNARGEEHNFLKKLSKPDSKESKTYVLKVSNPCIRAGYITDKRQFIDPAGGPMIVEGERIEEADAIVSSINYIVGYGYTVTFQ